MFILSIKKVEDMILNKNEISTNLRNKLNNDASILLRLRQIKINKQAWAPVAPAAVPRQKKKS